MTWLFILPLGILFIIIFLFIFTQNKDFYYKIKSFFPWLFIFFSLSLVLSILKSPFFVNIFYSDTLIYFFELSILFVILILLVKAIILFIFSFLLEKKQNIKYPRLIKDLVVILLYTIGILLITKYFLNIEITVVLASSAVLTVVIGFALQDILGDLFSGIALNLEESLKIGDWIKIAKYEGVVEQFRWRGINIRTIDNILIIIPNRIASKEEINCYGNINNHFALRFKIGVSYKNSPDQVIATILKVLQTTPSVLKSPAPMVMVHDYDDFAIIYDIKFWLNDFAQQDILKSEIRRKLWYAFKRKGIQIPFPIRDIYIKDVKKEKISGFFEWTHLSVEEKTDILLQNEVLNTIDKKQLASLSSDVEFRIYGRDELLIKEGEQGQFFYHFLRGGAKVVKDNKVVSHLKNNDYVGEMSLFTGENTVANVQITEESQLLCISSEKFKETIKLNEQMARKLSEVIALRKSQILEIKNKMEDSQITEIKKETENIFQRIKKYFSL